MMVEDAALFGFGLAIGGVMGICTIAMFVFGVLVVLSGIVDILCFLGDLWRKVKYRMWSKCESGDRLVNDDLEE